MNVKVEFSENTTNVYAGLAENDSAFAVGVTENDLSVEVGFEESAIPIPVEFEENDATFTAEFSESVGRAGVDGKSAYEIALDHGFDGSEEEWLESLHGEDGAAGSPGIPGAPGKDGEPGKDGYTPQKGIDYTDGYTPIKGVDYNDGYTPIKGVDYFDGKDGYTPEKGVDYFDGHTPVKGIDYFDGKDGKTPVKGVDYFDGKDGKDGENGKAGKDGVSCTHEWDGTVLTVTSASGTSSADLRGAEGKAGKDGVDGKDGLDGKDGTAGKDGDAGVYYGTTEPTSENHPVWIDPSEEVDGIPTKVSQLENDAGYLTEHQDLSAYAKKSDIPSVPTKTSQLTNDSGFVTSMGADYVLERGVASGWNWEKWNSGKYICWGTFSDTRAHYTTVNGFYGYYSSDFKYPITFPEAPIVHFNCKVGSGFAAPAGDVARSTVQCRCYALSTASGEVACVWELYVVGRWK